jgi:Lon protease-like protein
MGASKNWLKRTLPLLFEPDGVRQEMEMPIFPLHTVLFPGGLLPLRVFEQRYMDMVKACLKEEKPFGVCLIKEGEEVGAVALPNEVGCLARIVDWDMQQLGVLNLTVLGGQCFSIDEHRVEKSGLMIARVTFLSAEEPQPVPAELIACATVLKSIVEKVGEDNFHKPLHYDDAVWVGYRLAEVLPLKLPAKQAMLEMNDSMMRLKILHKFLHQQGLAA